VGLVTRLNCGLQFFVFFFVFFILFASKCKFEIL
jgi:hypothetical protein